MRFGPWLGLSLALATLNPGCAQAGDDGRTGLPSGGNGGSATVAALNLSFRQAPIELSPRETRTIEVKVTPEGAYDVRLALLGSVDTAATPDDAALDRSSRISDARGLASFRLTAPSTPGTFRLRAQVGASFLDTEVSVRADGLVHVAVHPIYDGPRQDLLQREWVATAAVGTSCEVMSADAPRYSVRALIGALELDDVPLAAEFAISASSGSLVEGCTTLRAPLANSVNAVTVRLGDRPVDLASTALDLVFGLDPRDAAFGAELDAANRELEADLRGEASSDATALLDEIELRLKPAQAQAFSLARAAAAWDSTLFEHSATCLTDPLRRWQDSGRRLLLSERAFEGRIGGTASAEVPAFALSRIGGTPAADASLTTQANSWSIDTSDTLAFSATFSWYPRALAAALTAAPAASETGSSDVPSALAGVVDCSSRGDGMAEDKRAVVAEFAATCDSTCLEFACQDALASLWSRATSVAADDSSELQVSGTGLASVVERDGHPDLNELKTGTWVGRLRHGGQTTVTGGALVGSRPR